MKKSINRKFNENGQVIEEQIVEEGLSFKIPFKKEKKEEIITDENGNVISEEKKDKKSVVGKVAAAAGIGLAVIGGLAFGISKSKKKDESADQPVVNYNYYLPNEETTPSPVDTATEAETTEPVTENDEVNVTEF